MRLGRAHINTIWKHYLNTFPSHTDSIGTWPAACHFGIRSWKVMGNYSLYVWLLAWLAYSHYSHTVTECKQPASISKRKVWLFITCIRVVSEVDCATATPSGWEWYGDSTIIDWMCAWHLFVQRVRRMFKGLTTKQFDSLCSERSC